MGKQKNSHKHKKNRNIGVIYEVLTREVARASLSGNAKKKDAGMYALKTFFARDTNANKMLELYSVLMETSGVTGEYAKRVLSEVYKVYADFVDTDRLEQEQNDILEYIGQGFDKKQMFMSFVPNYRRLATIGQLFDKNLPVQKRLFLEDKLVDFMTRKPETPQEELEPIDEVTLRVFLGKFNQQYAESLIPEQKKLILKYISSAADKGDEMKVYLISEVSRLERELDKAIGVDDVKSDETMVSGIKEVRSLLQQAKSQPVDDDMLSNIMKLQKLVHEVKNNDS